MTVTLETAKPDSIGLIGMSVKMEAHVWKSGQHRRLAGARPCEACDTDMVSRI